MWWLERSLLFRISSVNVVFTWSYFVRFQGKYGAKKSQTLLVNTSIDGNDGSVN